MADKSFGIKKFDLIGSGTPKIESPNNINLNAVNVAISTNATVGGTLDVEGASGFGTHISLPDHAKIRLGNTAGDFDIHYDNDAFLTTGSRGLGIQVHNGSFSVSSGANNDFKFGLTLFGFTSAVDLVASGSRNIGTNTIKWNDAHFSGTVNANTFSGSGASLTGIANANISNSAAIAGTKISPDFGTQNVTTTGTLGSGDLTITGTQPALNFIDDGQNPDFKLYNNNGILKLFDTTNSNDYVVVQPIISGSRQDLQVGIFTDFNGGSSTYRAGTFGNVLEIFGGGASSEGALRIGANSGATNNSTGIIQFFDNTLDSANVASIAAYKVPHNSTSTNRGCDLVFSTKVDQGSLTEKFRITDDGNVGIGTDLFPQLVVDSGNTAVLAVGIVTAHQAYIGDGGLDVDGLFVARGNVVLGDTSVDQIATFGSFINNLVPKDDDARDLGSSFKRWDDVFATNGTIQTSDRNYKENILESDLGLDFINKLSPKSFKFKGKTRTHYGLIAQDIETVITDLGKTTTEFAPLIKTTLEDETTNYGLRYTEFISPMIKAIQELKAENDSLKTRIAALEGS